MQINPSGTWTFFIQAQSYSLPHLIHAVLAKILPMLLSIFYSELLIPYISHNFPKKIKGLKKGRSNFLHNRIRGYARGV